MLSRIQALLAAVLIHGVVLLFGGLLLFHAPAKKSSEREVELIGDDAPEVKKEAEKEKPPVQEKASEDKQDDLEAPKESAPDMQQIAQLEGPPSAPALSALSLDELESVLEPDSGGASGFQEAVSLTSGGKIGGTGGPGSSSDQEPGSFALSELDQRPQSLQQVLPRYPTELRKRRIQGTVEVVFLVDTDGRVLEPRVDKTTNEAFNQPALEAVRQWRFEAGTKEGKKVRFKMRVPITFSAG